MTSTVALIVRFLRESFLHQECSRMIWAVEKNVRREDQHVGRMNLSPIDELALLHSRQPPEESWLVRSRTVVRCHIEFRIDMQG